MALKITGLDKMILEDRVDKKENQKKKSISCSQILELDEFLLK